MCGISLTPSHVGPYSTMLSGLEEEDDERGALRVEDEERTFLSALVSELRHSKRATCKPEGPSPDTQPPHHDRGCFKTAQTD